LKPENRLGLTFLVCALIAILIVTGVIYQAIGTARDARRFPPPGRMVDVGGFRLHMEDAGGGEGPVVVLEAGIAASSLSWSLVQPEVAKFARVIRYDRAGLAWSDLASGPRTAQLLAEELRALLEKTRITGPYVLVGHSFGGYIARMFTAKFPEQVAGLVLLDCPNTSEWIPLQPQEKRKLQGGALFSRIGAVLASLGVVRFCLARLTSGSTALPVMVTRSFGRSALTVVGRLVGEVQKLPAGVRPQVQAHWCQPKSFHSMASHLAHLPESAAQVEAAGTMGDIPLIVLTASKPQAARFAAQEAVARLSARGKHVVAETSGHWIHLDAPGLVVEMIREVCEIVGQQRGESVLPRGTAPKDG
jgi:pimeloyl-ACP methyl ester carboxylesterase